MVGGDIKVFWKRTTGEGKGTLGHINVRRKEHNDDDDSPSTVTAPTADNATTVASHPHC